MMLLEGRLAMWIVLKPRRFDVMELLSGLPVPVGTKTPEKAFMYCLVFESYDAAIKWNGGSTENIAEVEWKVGSAGI